MTFASRGPSSTAAPLSHFARATLSAICNRCAEVSTNGRNGLSVSPLAIPIPQISSVKRVRDFSYLCICFLLIGKLLRVSKNSSRTNRRHPSAFSQFRNTNLAEIFPSSRQYACTPKARGVRTEFSLAFVQSKARCELFSSQSTCAMHRGRGRFDSEC